MNFSSVSIPNSKIGVLCSARLSERLKRDKFSRNLLLTGYTIFGIEHNNNIENINKFWRVSTSFTLTLSFSVHKK